jgi:hypothetical protein
MVTTLQIHPLPPILLRHPYQRKQRSDIAWSNPLK